MFNKYSYKMKKLSIALFSVIILAIIGLYILYFTGNKKSSHNTSSSGTSVSGIAYVNIDSVIFKFDMFLDQRNSLLTKQQSAEAELNSKTSQYQKGANDYQDKVNKGLITRASAAQVEQSLMQQQQELVNLRDKLQNDLMEEEQVMNRQVVAYITKYLEENKDEYNCQYILGKSFGSVVLYSDLSQDITQKVLDGVNAKYKSEKK